VFLFLFGVRVPQLGPHEKELHRVHFFWVPFFLSFFCVSIVLFSPLFPSSIGCCVG